MIDTFSIAASSGRTTWHLQPCAMATIARLTAVLPALPSVTTPPTRRAPDFSACIAKYLQNVLKSIKPIAF